MKSVAVVALLSILGLVIADPNKPVFPVQYEAECHLQLPYVNIDETIVTWFDGVNQNQRIDYYGGQDQYFYIGQHNYTAEVVPTGLTATTCFENTNVSVSLLSVFPDISNFVYVPGNVQVNGVDCINWQYVQNRFGRTNTYNLYVSSATGLPVQYVMMGYDTLFGSHPDQYVLTYNSIVTGVNPEAFTTPSQFCTGSQSGPSGHTVLNPLEEMALFHPDSEAYEATTSKIDESFNKFAESFGRSYDDNERSKRRDVYYQNMRLVNSHNRKRSSFKLALNHLADWTRDEIFARNNKMQKTNEAPHVHIPKMSPNDYPLSFDWRSKGAVTAVKDQGVCGSCWSFGTAQTIEGAYFLKTGTLNVFSEQILVDCSWPYGNNGCDGGQDFQAYQWLLQAGGIVFESQYPYMMADGRCHLDNSTMTFHPISSYVNVTSGDQQALMDALLSQGPISVSIDASHDDFSFYSSGVYYNPACRNDVNGLDHSVLLVGYGTEDGQDYWLIKNSWSTHYGDEGYVKISRNNNNCGVATSPTYVIL